MTAPEPGWYPDPESTDAQRWWDGTSWTSSTRPVRTQQAEVAVERQQAPAGWYADPDGLGGERYWDGSGWSAERRSGVPDDVQPDASPAGGHGRRRAPVRAVVAVAVAAALTAGAGAAWAVLSGSGPQPEQAMPANTLAYVKLDLDPAAGQKVNLVRFLASNFPQTGLSNESGDPVGDILAQSGALDGADFTWAQVDAWLGDRIAVAALTGDGSEPVVPAAFVAVDDQEQMQQFMSAHAPQLHAAMVDADFAVIAAEQSVVDGVVAASSRLPDNAGYTAVREDLGGGQLLSGWFDYGAFADAAGDLGPSLASNVPLDGLDVVPLTGTQGPEVTGQVGFAVSVEPNVVELRVVSNDVSVDGVAPWQPADPVTDLGSLPASTLAAVGVSGLDDLVRTAGRDESFRQVLADAGVDGRVLIAALSSPLTVYAQAAQDGGMPVVAARSQTSDKDAWDKLLTSLGVTGEDVGLRAEDGYVHIVPQGQGAPAGGGQLQDLEVFQQALPQTGQLAAFVNLSTVWELMKEQDSAADLPENLTAVGVSVDVPAGEPGDGSAVVRLVVKPVE